LDLEFAARVIDVGNGIEQAVHDKFLVEDGQLDGDAWQIGPLAGGLWTVMVMPVVKV